MYIQIIDNTPNPNGETHVQFYDHNEADDSTMVYAQSIRLHDTITFEYRNHFYTSMLMKKHYDVEYGGLSFYVKVISKRMCKEDI